LITQVVLSQTATTDGTAGKLGDDKARDTVKKELVKADADLICSSLNNSIIRWLVQWNYPDAALPKVWRDMEESENLSLRAERETKIFSWGFRPSLEHVHSVYGGDWQDVQTVTPDQDTTEQDASSFAESDPDDLADVYANDLREQMVEPVSGMLEPIQALLDSAGSLEAFRDGLNKLYPDMPAAEFTELMTDALVAAELAGRVDILDGR